jgi:ferric-dicitrate binding protein FerR (iron transport regulator)
MINLFASSTSNDRDPTSAEQTAVEWVVRCASGLEPAHEREFRNWLGAAPENQALFDEFSDVWAAMQRIGDEFEGVDVNLYSRPEQPVASSYPTAPHAASPFSRQNAKNTL